jgi:hypothetical protein
VLRSKQWTKLLSDVVPQSSSTGGSADLQAGRHKHKKMRRTTVTTAGCFIAVSDEDAQDRTVSP